MNPKSVNFIGYFIPKRVENMNDPAMIEVIKKRYAKLSGGPVWLRGRHPDRKSVLGATWRPHSQNDIHPNQAERIAVYKHWRHPKYGLPNF